MPPQPALELHRHDRRNHVTCTLQQHGVADADVLALAASEPLSASRHALRSRPAMSASGMRRAHSS